MTSISMQSHIEAFAAQQPTHNSMQMVLESHAYELFGLHSWSHKHSALFLTSAAPGQPGIILAFSLN